MARKWESLRGGGVVPAAGKDLTLIGLSNRHVRLPLSQGRWYEVGFFSWGVGASVF